MCRFWEDVICDAKREARSELSVSKGDWQRQGAAHSTELSSQEYNHNQVTRVHARDLSVEQFISQYEAPKVPVIIEGLLDDWPAKQAWEPGELLRRFAETRFKVGSDDEGYPVRMKLKHYLLYVTDERHGKDDSPLYVFDGTFAEDKYAPGLSQVSPC